MSDILSNYYKTFYTKNNTINTTKNFFTPNKKIINKKDRTAENLSPYGIYLSENNTLLISKKNGIPPLSLTMNKKFFIDKYPTNSEKESIGKSINFNSEEEKISQELRYKDKNKKNNNLYESLDPKLKKCFSYRKKNKILLYNITNLSSNKKIKNYKKDNIIAIMMNNTINNKNKNINNGNNNDNNNNNDNINNDNVNNNDIINNDNNDNNNNINNNDNINNGNYINNDNNNKKSRNNMSEFSTLKTGCNNYVTTTNNNFPTTTSIISSSRNQENKTFYKTIKKEKDKNFFYKETKKDKIKNKKEADKIINELLSLKTKKDIKSYYIKKDYARAITEAENKYNFNFNINKCINPMTYIKFNLANEPKNNNLFKSFDTQIMIMGNQKYRNDLLDGVNMYKNQVVKYEDLRGPIGYDKNQIEEKKRNEIIKKMKMNYVGNRGLIFSNRLYKKKFNKKYFDFEFDDNYKNVKKLLYKNIEKYEKQIKFNKGKKVPVDMDKKDINILKKIDSEAEFVIHDKNEMIKFTHKFLSFDNKVDKLLSKTRHTTDYLFKRAQEHHQIKKRIDQLYTDIEENRFIFK